MKDIIDGIKYLDGKTKDLDSKIEKGEDILQELRARRLLNRMETRRYNPKFHKDIVENQERELREIDQQIEKAQSLVNAHQKKREERKQHLEELEQQWRKQSPEDTPASIPQDKPQTPAGATLNKPQTMTQKQGKARQGKANDVTTSPIPSGAKVSDIDMVFLDDKTVRIIIQNQSAVYNFAQMGFMDKNTGNPNKLWSELAIYDFVD